MQRQMVQFTNPMIVTNGACCSNSRVMCERCAAAALASLAPMPYVHGGLSPVLNVADESDVLPDMTTDWTPNGAEPTVNVVDEDDGLPTLDW